MSFASFMFTSLLIIVFSLYSKSIRLSGLTSYMVFSLSSSSSSKYFIISSEKFTHGATG